MTEFHPPYGSPVGPNDTTYTEVTQVADVTDEILDAATDYAEGFYVNRGVRIDWQDLFDSRLEGLPLDDGTTLTLGNEYDTPAMRKIQREVRKRLTD